MNKKTKTIIWIIVAVISVFLIYTLLGDVIGRAQEVDYLRFEELIINGADVDGDLTTDRITKLNVDAYNLTGYVMKDGKVIATYTTNYSSLYGAMDFEWWRTQIVQKLH